MANPNIYALTDNRWSNAGTTYQAIWMDLNNGAAGSAVGAAASRPFLFTNNGIGNLIFSFDLSGNIYAAGSTLTLGGSVVTFTSGVLGVANGGTGRATLTNHSVLVGATAGAITQIAVPASGTLFQGVAAADPTWTATPTLGVQQTTQGSLTLANTAAGAFATTVQSSNSASAAWTMTLPVTAGTGGYLLSTDGTGVTSWILANGTGTVTSVSFTGGLISVATATTTPAFTVAGTSGGIPYFSGAATWASSGVLASHGIVLGGGAGAAPHSVAVPASGTILQGVASADPTWTATPTLGVQQTTQGQLILANTAAGAFATTIQSSNSASAAWTMTLPTTAGSNTNVLSTDGSGVLSWVAAGSGTVTSVAQSFTGGLISVGGSPITTTGTLALTVAGTSGGVVYFSSGTTWASSAVLAIHGIILGGGAGAAPYTVTVPASGTVLQGVATSDPTWTATPTLGVQQTTQGSVILANTAAGAFATTVQSSNSATAAWTLTLPTTAGTNGFALTTNGSGVTSWTALSTGTVTSVAQSFTGGIISVGGSPITTSGTLALTVAGTSGGVVYFNSGTTWASSALLAQHGVMLGGGAGAAPYTVAVPASGTILQGVATSDPTWTATPTLGVQQTTQGALMLANTAAGAFTLTLQSSNSATASYTLTFPTTAGTNGYALTTNGSGLCSWTQLQVGTVTSIATAGLATGGTITTTGTITVTATTNAQALVGTDTTTAMTAAATWAAMSFWVERFFGAT